MSVTDKASSTTLPKKRREGEERGEKERRANYLLWDVDPIFDSNKMLVKISCNFFYFPELKVPIDFFESHLKAVLHQLTNSDTDQTRSVDNTFLFFQYT